MIIEREVDRFWENLDGMNGAEERHVINSSDEQIFQSLTMLSNPCARMLAAAYESISLQWHRRLIECRFDTLCLHTAVLLVVVLFAR